MNAPAFGSPLADGIEQFLKFKRAAGCRYREEERILRHLDRFLKSHLKDNHRAITLDVVRAYMAQRSETAREHHLSLIRELCRFLAVEDPRTEVPPRNFLGIRRRPFVQRVLSRQEGKDFLNTCANFPPARCSALRGVVHGTALTLLYLTGLRLGEALRLTLGDVHLSTGILRVRQAKFGKSRFVPMASDLTERMRTCQGEVEKWFGPRSEGASFFIGPKGKPVSSSALRASFHEVLLQAGIVHRGANRRPRLHDLRATFAVHRLLIWYEQDADLAAKLPLLSTYLGHVGLASSQRYIQLTQDLLGEVTRRHELSFGHLIKDGTR